MNQELQRLVDQDQADRAGAASFTRADWGRVKDADRQRRARVSAISAGGCLHSSSDYAAAALVFQHGDAPEDFLTAFRWARQAVELGDASKRDLVALTVDRYLVMSGHRQLFGSQSGAKRRSHVLVSRPRRARASPDEERAKYMGPISSRYEHVRSLNNGQCAALGVRRAPGNHVAARHRPPGFW